MTHIQMGNREEREYVRRKLIEFNARHVPDDLRSVYEEIDLMIKDDEGNVIGGLLGELCWNWIEVHILWVDQAYRGSRHGSKLLKRIEEIARDKHCTFIKLNTFSFQAPEFYLKHGYREVAVFEDAPRGFKHYYFRKDLSAGK
ncbi:GNAT family N-acetyltransferase [Paenibacillus ginsengarvi]|uniref:GNAT family N-acetyltransferase n=1 Tax=Paenibacillus ginsengarvi TaxID=400777 RepID=A0A3B0AY37_9BACL|nr:GNAT family N-acetyltransferase [Paenibacillus ginsengarvi]RKN64897.1 GNAT family N-acetyltransferase [Paenibacillus ginsengarvi]